MRPQSLGARRHQGPCGLAPSRCPRGLRPQGLVPSLPRSLGISCLGASRLGVLRSRGALGASRLEALRPRILAASSPRGIKPSSPRVLMASSPHGIKPSRCPSDVAPSCPRALAVSHPRGLEPSGLWGLVPRALMALRPCGLGPSRCPCGALAPPEHRPPRAAPLGVSTASCDLAWPLVGHLVPSELPTPPEHPPLRAALRRPPRASGAPHASRASVTRPATSTRPGEPRPSECNYR